MRSDFYCQLVRSKFGFFRSTLRTCPLLWNLKAAVIKHILLKGIWFHVVLQSFDIVTMEYHVLSFYDPNNFMTKKGWFAKGFRIIFVIWRRVLVCRIAFQPPKVTSGWSRQWSSDSLKISSGARGWKGFVCHQAEASHGGARKRGPQASETTESRGVWLAWWLELPKPASISAAAHGTTDATNIWRRQDLVRMAFPWWASSILTTNPPGTSTNTQPILCSK